MQANKKRTNAVAAGLTSAALIAGAGTAATIPATNAAEQISSPIQAGALVQGSHDGGIVQLAEVQGRFTFTQEEVTPLATIARAMGDAARFLCGANTAQAQEATTSSDRWSVAISGDVENAYSATLDELAQAKSEHTVMGCSCSGNPSDGQASVNADVTGIPIQTILELARPLESANTVLFVSKDGYEVALPLFYMKHHYSLLAYEVNGQPLTNSMGGINQLWLGSTSARYYGRYIVEIRLETRNQEPATPGTPEAGIEQSVPNASVLSADSE